MPPDPAFDSGDKTTTTTSTDDGLPAELKGKSAAEVHQFYVNRESQYADELARERARKTSSEPSSQRPSAADFYNDPATATERIVSDKAVTKDEFQRTVAGAVPGLIAAARAATRDKFQRSSDSSLLRDFDRFVSDIESLMSRCTPEQQMQPYMWETAFYQVRGLKAGQLVVEAEARGKGIIAEQVTPAAPEPVKPKELTSEQRYITSRIGISEKQYQEAQQKLGSNIWPLTVDNRSR